MGSSVSDLVTGMKVFSDPKIHHFDPFSAPSPWREAEFKEVQEKSSKKIKVGILSESSFLTCSASIKRAIKLTKAALIAHGYEVVDFNIQPEDWRASTDHFMGMVANGNTPMMLEDFA